jgi:hypothetical protein
MSSMNKELISRLAQEAGVREERYPTSPPRPTGCMMIYADSLERFAALVSEECARVADEFAKDADTEDEFAGNHLAAAIRALFAPPASQ